jgi:predicted dehydrogenase
MSTRREFLQAAAAAGLSRTVYGQSRDRKLKIGVIGTGWYGMVDMNAAYEVGNVECAAVADVDSAHLEAAATECEKKQGTRPKTFKDYRELIQAPGLDAVIIGTPPHWHALNFIEACAKGLPVYLEKPVSYDVREGQAMVNAWKKAGNVVQVGFQRRQQNGYREAQKYIESGQPGRIVQIDAQIHYTAGLLSNKPEDPPATLDWDLWCGPAPKLPYSPQIGHKSWRLEKEYGAGHLVDWGIHVIDEARVILGADIPKRIHATGGLYQLKDRITTPDTMAVHFEFENAPVVWRHRLWGAAEFTPEVRNGLLLFCEKETVFATDDRWEIIPRKGEHKVVQVPEARDAGKDHMADFLNAVRDGKQPGCTIDDAWNSTSAVHLAMISYYTGSPVEWDKEKKSVSGNVAANKLLKREYRTPYKHPYSG